MKVAKNILFVTLFCFFAFVSAISVSAEVYSGNCGVDGDNITWSLDSETGVLTLTGSGEMGGWNASDNVPWTDHKDIIQTVEFYGDITNIASGAFLNCTKLSSIEIPKTVKKIGSSAFTQCYSLKEIYIPQNVEQLSSEVFNDCTSLTYITVDKNNQYYRNDHEGVLFDKEFEKLICYPTGKKLKKYVLPNTCKILDYSAFFNCDNLYTIILNEGLLTIKTHAFHLCDNITSITIPSSVTEILGYPFGRYNALESIHVDENNQYYSSDENGILYNKAKTELVCVPSQCNFTSYYVPESIEFIHAEAFFNCANINKVFFLSPNTEISYSSFYSNVTIYGYQNSTAIAYAQEYNIKYNYIIPGNPDINYDEYITYEDIKKLCNEISQGTNTTIYDLNEDGKTNLLDINYLTTLVKERIQAQKDYSDLDLHDEYVIVLQDTPTISETTVNGVSQKIYTLKIYENGEIKNVRVKNITTDSPEYNEISTPETNKIFDENGNPIKTSEYGFASYVDKIARAVVDNNSEYVFELLDFSINTDPTQLLSNDTDTLLYEYRTTNVTTKFNQKTTDSSIYNLDHANVVSNNIIKGVYVQDYTQIIIKSKDKTGEWIVSTYDADNLPDIKKYAIFEHASYILVNNKSTLYENLAVFYGVIDGELKSSIGEFAEPRVVKSYSKTSTENGTIITYDVFNPLNGTVESAIEGTDTDAKGFTKGAIVGLTAKAIINDEALAAGNAYEAGELYNIDDPAGRDFEDFDGTTGKKLGFVKIEEYDTPTGYLTIDAEAYTDVIFQVTDETVVTFSDKSEEIIKVVDAKVLASTAKIYRQNEDKNEDLRAFLCIEESDDADEDNIIYKVLFAMIVRDQSKQIFPRKRKIFYTSKSGGVFPFYAPFPPKKHAPSPLILKKTVVLC